MTSDPNVADPVKLAAIKDALDRGGIQAKTAVLVEVSTKPYELVFDSISAGPREAHDALAELESPTEDKSDEDSEIVGEFDEDEFDDYPPGIYRREESESAAIVDVEVVDPGYTDANHDHGSGPITPDSGHEAGSVELGDSNLGPLGMRGPTGSGLMRLEDAVEAVAEMRDREAARVRDLRRR